MDVVVGEGGRVEAVWSGGKAQVAFLEDVVAALMVEQHPHADVELVSLQQQRIFNILLQDQ